LGLAALDGGLPGGGLPLGCLHEIAGAAAGDDGAAVGFAAVVLGRLAGGGRRVIWLTRRRDLYPPGLAGLGLVPERLIPVPVRRDRDALWAMEEALRHRGLAAVLGEIDELDMVASRRLQLAAEAMGVTGLLLRRPAPPPAASAAVTRWRLASVASVGASGLVGPPRWRVELLRCRGGQPGHWVLEWNGEGFRGEAEAGIGQECKPEVAVQGSTTTRLRPVALAS
jgi:protein ImuA